MRLKKKLFLPAKRPRKSELDHSDFLVIMTKRALQNNNEYTDIAVRLRSFRKTTDYLIYDLEAVVNEKKEFRIYFDAVDIVNAVEGAPAFYDPALDDSQATLNFKEEIFESKRTLVNCLLISGVLGKVHLLLPHQGELSLHVKGFVAHGTKLNIKPYRLAKLFLDDTKFSEIPWEEIANGEFSETKARKIISGIPSSRAKDFFKAVQCLQPWHSRLLDMMNNGILETSVERIHYEPAGMFDLIFDLNEALQIKRGGVKANNFTDSLAMGALIEKIRNYKSGGSNELPCFFASEYPVGERHGIRFISKTKSQNAFRKIVTGGEFSSHFFLDDKDKISAIRDDEYFILRATFVDDKNEETLANSLIKLKNLREQLDVVLQTSRLSQLDEEPDSDPYLDGSSIIEEIEDDLFFKDVWIPSNAPKQFSNAVRDIVRASEEVKKSQNVEEAARKQLERATKTWDQQAKLARNIQDMWKKLREWKRWQDIGMLQQGADPEIEQRIFKHLGFFRYSFPDKDRGMIAEHLRDLLQGGETEKEARKTFLFAYINSLDPDDIDQRSLLIVVSTLLLTENFGPLKTLLDKTSHASKLFDLHFSFRIVYGRALLEPGFMKRKEIFDEIDGVINSLLAESSREKSQLEKARILRGVAYLYYWLWVAKGGEAAWRKLEGFSYKNPPELQKPIEQAINYAKQSYVLLNNLNKEKLGHQQDQIVDLELTYALNMYLYHMVEADNLHKNKREMIDIADRLLQDQGREYLWQYRFDDTLAVYYAKRAFMEDDRKKRTTFIDIAETMIGQTIKDIEEMYGRPALYNRDRDVKEHGREIKLLKKVIYKSAQNE